jgi:alkylhydroperoxidase family enzyme
MIPEHEAQGELKALGYSDSQIEAQTARLGSTDLDPLTRALLDLAEKATLTPTQVGDAEVQALFAADVSEPELLEAMLVVSFFNGINRKSGSGYRR